MKRKKRKKKSPITVSKRLEKLENDFVFFIQNMACNSDLVYSEIIPKETTVQDNLRQLKRLQRDGYFTTDRRFRNLTDKEIEWINGAVYVLEWISSAPRTMHSPHFKFVKMYHSKGAYL